MDEDNIEKERLLQPIRAIVEEINRKLEEGYTAAEKAVDALFTNQLVNDYLRDKKSIENILQQFHQYGVSLSDSISTSVSALWKQEALKIPIKCSGGTSRLPMFSVTFEKSYKVEMLLPGTPDQFWLRFVGTSIQIMENLLNSFYYLKTCLVSYPQLGSYVICLSDRKFCRALVTQVISSPGGAASFEVLLVDYGQVQGANLNSLFAMHEQFCQQPAIALLCTLGEMPSMPASIHSTKFYFGPSENLTAVFHAVNKHGRLVESNTSYPIFHVTLHKTVVSSTCSRIVTVRSLLQRTCSESTREKPPGIELDSNQSCIAQSSYSNMPVIQAASYTRASNLSYYADPKYDSKWDKAQSPLTAQGRQNLLHSSMNGPSQFMGSSCSKGSRLYRPSNESVKTPSSTANEPPVSAKHFLSTLAPTASAVPVLDTPIAKQLPAPVQGSSPSHPLAFPGPVGPDPVSSDKFPNTCVLMEPEFDLSDSVSFVTASTPDSDQLTIDESPNDGAENNEEGITCSQLHTVPDKRAFTSDTTEV